MRLHYPLSPIKKDVSMWDILKLLMCVYITTILTCLFEFLLPTEVVTVIRYVDKLIV